eukprot:CAMPEP_0178399176 /NCGR_PEP_ID=MMETSP0689_2-20121128/15148_1 /TAXON_ID=160604 /ORGANISM="Amphidinium massartii, Strain CS-259" /LENGTH=250 /DNA_ID=CAMNT_0020019951 /DNA_START=54 /DNA_END=806 /DNA_ORIENTATION=+
MAAPSMLRRNPASSRGARPLSTVCLLAVGAASAFAALLTWVNKAPQVFSLTASANLGRRTSGRVSYQAAESLRDRVTRRALRGMHPEDTSVVDFGKYKGDTFADVIRNDPDYCEWILGVSDVTSGSMMQFQRYLSENFVPPTPDEQIVAFGKYKGETFSDMLRLDPDYCEWILGLSDVTSGSAIRFQQYLSENFVAPTPDEQTVSFGKYKGETFSATLSIDPEYCEYVLTLEDPSASMEKFQAYIRENLQ